MAVPWKGGLCSQEHPGAEGSRALWEMDKRPQEPTGTQRGEVCPDTPEDSQVKVSSLPPFTGFK